MMSSVHQTEGVITEITINMHLCLQSLYIQPESPSKCHQDPPLPLSPPLSPPPSSCRVLGHFFWHSCSSNPVGTKSLSPGRASLDVCWECLPVFKFVPILLLPPHFGIISVFWFFFLILPVFVWGHAGATEPQGFKARCPGGGRPRRNEWLPQLPAEKHRQPQPRTLVRTTLSLVFETILFVSNSLWQSQSY